MRTLTSPAFVAAVALLVLNDWVLKPALGNWWTGKLSDFAGLFAFPLFWSAFFPQRRRIIFTLTAIGFIWWKSPLSTPVLAAWNSLGAWPLERVIDYTDWIAIVALVPAYRAVRGTAESARHHWPLVAHRAFAVVSTVIAVFAFAATTKPPPVYSHAFPAGSEYQVNGARLTIRAYFLTHDWLRDNRSPETAVDTMGGGGIRLTLRDGSPCGTALTLIDFSTTDEYVALDSVRADFEAEVIALLSSRFPAC